MMHSKFRTTTRTQNVTIELKCDLTGDPDARGAVRIYEDGLATNNTVDCNDGEQRLVVNNTEVQVGEIEILGATDQAHMTYTITVIGFQ